MEPVPTLADAVAAGRAAQVESRLAAAVLRPLHLRTARRAAEGGVAGHAALRGRCGEKTPSVAALEHLPWAQPWGGAGKRPKTERGPFSKCLLQRRERKDR